MAAFLIDYENVSGAGLKGVQYLKENDILVLFYSKSCKMIRNDDMEAIISSKCSFMAIKLQQQQKNGLDFYICAEAGSQAERGESQIAIISKDAGFMAVIDFLCIQYGGQGFRAVKAPSVENAIVKLDSPEDEDRRRQVQKGIVKVDIGQEYAKYKERNDLKERLKDAIVGTAYENQAANILTFADSYTGSPPKILYAESLHNFGRVNGLQIYHILKEVNKEGDAR